MPARGWLAYEELSKKRADLIALNIVGARDGSAHVDYTVNAITGFPMVTVPVGHDGPVNAVAPPWDLATAYAGAMAILAAERHRRLTGEGQRIVLPLQDMALSVTSALGYIGEAVVNQVDRPRFGNEIFGTFGRDFKTKDGRFVMICIFSDRHVDALASAGGFADAFKKIEAAKGVDLKTDAGRWLARAELCAVIEPWVAAQSAADVGAALKKAGALGRPTRLSASWRPTRPTCSTIRCSRSSTSPASAATRWPPRRCSSARCRGSRPERLRFWASVRTRSCRVFSASRTTRSRSCMIRKSSQGQSNVVIPSAAPVLSVAEGRDLSRASR